MQSTDVKHTIAGFYYQVLLACKEVTHLLNNSISDESYVAIEYGADVRIYDHNDIRMEAKFYSDNTFTRHKEAITHSIYNFFCSFDGAPPNVKYRLKTNVPINTSDISFFQEWSDPVAKSRNIRYVKECFVCESIGREPVKNGEFKRFQKKFKRQHPHLKQPQYKRELIKYLAQRQEPDEYLRYIIPTIVFNDHLLERFIEHIEYDFPQSKVPKYESINDLKASIDSSLLSFDASLREEDRSKIALLILEEFLDSTVELNTSKITISRCKEIFSQYQSVQLKYFDKQEYQEIMQEIEDEFYAYEYLLNTNGFSDYLDDIMAILIGLKEQLYSEIDLYGVENVFRRFVMSRGNYPLEVISLFKSITEMMIKTNRNDEQASVIDVDKMNNIKVGEQLSFSLRAVPAASSKRNNPTQIINSFIQHTQSHKEIAVAEGSETIIFDTECDVCQFALDDLDATIIDISKIVENKQYHEFYKSFKYKCTKCLKLSFTGACPFLKELKGE